MIPAELKKVANWCVYKIEKVNGKQRKLPINAKTGGNAQSNNPSTWCDYETALGAVGKYGEGLGFFFSPPYFGVDIDGVREAVEDFKSGQKNNIVGEFIHALNSYSETSVSGGGLHIICKGTLPEGGRRRGNVEMYSEGRYFIMTGKSVHNVPIRDCTEAIKPLHEKYIKAAKPKNLDIMDIIQKSKQADQFNTLNSGSWEGLYPSQSEADLAFANMLAFWTGRDKAQMDSIFRKSGLMRDKWDRRIGKTTYGDSVLDKAIAGCSQVFTSEEYSVTIGRKFYGMDDTGNAERFADKYLDYARYSYIDKGWYTYDGRKWIYDLTGNIKAMTEDVIRDMAEETYEDEKAHQKHLKYTRSNKGKVNMLKEAEHKLSILPSAFDKDKEVFNCQNGVLNLKTGELRNHDYKEYLTKISKVEYTDKSDCPQWEAFLQQIFDYDNELVEFIQRAVGYSLSGSTREQVMFILHGNGRNGKTTMLDILTMIFGDYAVNIQPESIMVKPMAGSANSDIARLKGARFVTSAEPNEGMRLNEGLVKQLTGGDRVTARHLYSREFEFEPDFKLWFATNHVPIIRGRDLGIWRRIMLIPFAVQIPEHKVDKSLKHKLKKELPGILSWAVDGCLRWQREGLNPPDSVIRAVEEYKNEMDVISAFLSACTVTIGEVKASELYQAYANWAEENNEYKMSATKFGKEMGLRFKKIRNDGIRYQGLSLNLEIRQSQYSNYYGFGGRV